MDCSALQINSCHIHIKIDNHGAMVISFLRASTPWMGIQNNILIVHPKGTEGRMIIRIDISTLIRNILINRKSTACIQIPVQSRIKTNGLGIHSVLIFICQLSSISRPFVTITRNIKMTVSILIIIQPFKHGRIYSHCFYKIFNISQGILPEKRIVMIHCGRKAHLLSRCSEMIVPEKCHCFVNTCFFF